MFSSALREIRGLIEEVTRSDPSADPLSIILSPLLLAKLPPSSRLEWNRRHTDPAERFALMELQSFAEKEVDTLRSLAPPHTASKPERSALRATSAALTSRTTTKAPSAALALRTTTKAPRIKDIPPKHRLAAASQSLCFNCLAPGHTVSSCPSQRNCSICKGRHHNLLHGLDSSPRKPFWLSPETDSQEDQPTSQSLTASAPPHTPFRCTLLQTAVVLASSRGRTATCRLLLDGGSEQSFVTRALARKLQPRPRDTRTLAIEGFGGGATSTIWSRIKQQGGRSTSTSGS